MAFGKASVDIDIDYDPMPHLFASSMQDLALDIRSYREPLKRAIQGVIAPRIQYGFEVGGPGWQPLAQATVDKKGHSQILVEEGNLRRISGQLNIWTIDGPGGEAYVSQLPGAEYGVFHQEGTQYMPAREFLVIHDESMDEIEQVFDRWLAERFVKHGWVPGVEGVV